MTGYEKADLVSFSQWILEVDIVGVGTIYDLPPVADRAGFILLVVCTAHTSPPIALEPQKDLLHWSGSTSANSLGDEGQQKSRLVARLPNTT